MIGPAGLAFRRRCWRELRQTGALWQTCDQLQKILEEKGGGKGGGGKEGGGGGGGGGRIE